MLLNQTSPIGVNTSNSRMTLYWASFSFFFVYLFSGLTLVLFTDDILLLTPNVLNFTAAAVITIIITFQWANKWINNDGLISSLGLLVAYLLYLLVTIVWAEYPDYTLGWLRIDVLNIFSFSLFYLLSLNYKTEKIAQIHTGLIIPAAIYTIIVYFLNNESSRLGPSSFFSAAAIFAIYAIVTSVKSKARLYFYFAFTFLFVILSMHKTTLLSFIVGIAIMLVFSRLYKALGNITRTIVIALLLMGVGFTVSEDLQRLGLVTYARITGNDVSYGKIFVSGEATDEVRAEIFRYANELIEDHYVFGIGYMNFMPYYASEHQTQDFVTASGRTLAGTSVHNMYQAWLVEGGIPLIVIMLLSVLKYFKILRQKIKLSTTDNEKLLYKTLIVAMIQLLVTGIYHQVHQTQQFWMMFGFVYALKYKKTLLPDESL